MSAQQQSYITTGYASGAGSPITAGQCVVLDVAGTYYGVSTSAQRTAVARRTSGIAISSCSGTGQDRAFSVQYVGEIPPSITGLGAGTTSLVRVSTAGVLERVGSYSTSDDVCGYCDVDGTAHVCFPLIGLGAALGASSAPGLPANSIQYYLNPSALGGAAHASISADGDIETRMASEAVAANGFWRVGYNPAPAHPLIGALDSVGATWSLLSLDPLNAGGPVLGNANLGVMSVVGSGVVIHSNTVVAVLNANTFQVSTGGVERFQINNSYVQSKVPRIGDSTAWGASEGTQTITATGAHTLTPTEYEMAEQVFSGAGTGTYTYPAPTSDQTNFHWLTETGGVDKTITIGSATTYALKANSHAYVKFTSTGVFGLSDSASGGAFSFSGSLTDDATDFYLANGGILVAALSSMAVPVAYLGCPTPSGGMVAKQLKVGLPVALASGETCTVTLLKNGSATAITKVIAHSDVMPVVITGSVSYSETDAWDVIANASSTDGAFPVQATLTWGPP